MTQEEKAKRYDEALEIAKKNYVTSQDLHEGSQIGIECFKNTLESIFPELNESEDEKIKKEIIDYIKTGTYHKKWVTWLEKQGEPNPYEDERVRKAILEGLIDCRDAPDLGWSNFGGIEIDDCIAWLEKLCNKPQSKSALEAIREEKVDNANKIKPKDYSSIDPHFGKPIDKVNPKFHEGEWTVSNLDRKARQISEVHFDEYNSYYVVNGKEVNLEEYDRLHHSWTIQDAKDGDVLATEDKNFTTPFVAIYKSIGDTVYDNITFNSHCFIGFDGNFYGGEEGHTIEDIHPATKEQRKLLSQRMKEAGYEWDAEKKELRKEE